MCARGDSTHFTCLVRVRSYQSVDSGASHPPCGPALCHQVEEEAIYPHHVVFFPSTHALHLGLETSPKINNVSQKSESTYDLESDLSTDSNTTSSSSSSEIYSQTCSCFTRITSLHSHCLVLSST